jgi:hypothetical protein
MKTTVQQKITPRNPIVMASIKRSFGSGVHGKPYKAQRSQFKAELRAGSF